MHWNELRDVQHATRINVRMRAYGEVLIALRRVHGSCYCLDAKSVRKKHLSDECARLQRELGLRSIFAKVETVFARNRFP